MSTVRESIEVAVPARVAHEQLCHFENYPRFMSGVMRLTPLSDTSAHMVLDIGGCRAEFDANIIESRPGEYLCWEATDGPEVSEAVQLEEISNTATRLTAEFHIDAHQLALTESGAMEVLNQRLKADLKGFKRFCEENAPGTAQATPTSVARGIASASGLSHAVNERPTKGVPPAGNLGPILSNNAPGRHTEATQMQGRTSPRTGGTSGLQPDDDGEVDSF